MCGPAVRSQQFAQHLHGSSDAQRRLLQVEAFGVQLGEHLLAGLEADGKSRRKRIIELEEIA